MTNLEEYVTQPACFSDDVSNLAMILASIQANLKSPKDLRNNFGNFSYRNAESILEAFKEEIKKDKYPKDIYVITHFSLILIGNRTFLECIASLKSSKECIQTSAYAELDISKKGMDQAQLTGAATSYAKKYALCNLFAIDDSRSDPDADEKPQSKKNAFGLAPDGPLANGDDMKQTLNEENQKQADLIIEEIKTCETEAEVVDVGVRYKKQINSLKKYNESLFNDIVSAGLDAKDKIRKENEARIFDQ